MTDEPTNRELLEAIDSLALAIGSVEERLEAKIDGLERRLNTRMDGLASKADLYAVRDELKNEIASAYELHEQRVQRLEAAVGE